MEVYRDFRNSIAITTSNPSTSQIIPSRRGCMYLSSNCPRRSRPKPVVHWVFQLLLECKMINIAATATNARM
jgi:hypothetical protein